jgi:hypothetical protein
MISSKRANLRIRRANFGNLIMRFVMFIRHVHSSPFSFLHEWRVGALNPVLSISMEKFLKFHFRHSY